MFTPGHGKRRTTALGKYDLSARTGKKSVAAQRPFPPGVWQTLNDASRRKVLVGVRQLFFNFPKVQLQISNDFIRYSCYSCTHVRPGQLCSVLCGLFRPDDLTGIGFGFIGKTPAGIFQR